MQPAQNLTDELLLRITSATTETNHCLQSGFFAALQSFVESCLSSQSTRCLDAVLPWLHGLSSRLLSPANAQRLHCDLSARYGTRAMRQNATAFEVSIRTLLTALQPLGNIVDEEMSSERAALWRQRLAREAQQRKKELMQKERDTPVATEWLEKKRPTGQAGQAVGASPGKKREAEVLSDNMHAKNAKQGKGTKRARRIPAEPTSTTPPPVKPGQESRVEQPSVEKHKEASAGLRRSSACIDLAADASGHPRQSAVSRDIQCSPPEQPATNLPPSRQWKLRSAAD